MIYRLTRGKEELTVDKQMKEVRLYSKGKTSLFCRLCPTGVKRITAIVRILQADGWELR